MCQASPFMCDACADPMNVYASYATCVGVDGLLTQSLTVDSAKGGRPCLCEGLDR